MKILIINGHPYNQSYCSSLSETYMKGALSTGNEVYLLSINDLKFDPILKQGFSNEQKLEDDLVVAQNKIKWADHIVIVHPVWWGSVPALLKGFFDRVLIPGFAFKYKKESVLWDKLLSGKTAHIIYTTDTPLLLYKYYYFAPSVNMIKKRVLAFCGIKTTAITAIGPIRTSNENLRKKWLRKIEIAGERAL